MNDCLIKESKYNYAIKYNEVSDIVDLRLIKNKFNTDFKENNFSFTNKNGFYLAKKNINYNILNLLMDNISLFSEELSYFTDNFTSKSIDNIIIYYLIDLTCLIELKNKNIINDKEFYKYLTEIDYISKEYLESLRQIIFFKKTVIKTSFDKNKNLLTTNKSSYEFPKNLDNLKNRELKTLIKSLDLPLLEIPNNKDVKNTANFLRYVLKLKRELNLKRFNFSLRIKKTKKENQGMFIVNSNTIIIDPRNPEVFIHELGHYIYENKLAFTYNDKRYYPSQFKNYVNKYKKQHKITIKREELEKYSDDSEVFALWFEKEIKYE
tara:strand:- start:3548 stop:4513 length:966 start_codon:yes stop_codon:yes gene_type:complete